MEMNETMVLVPAKFIIDQDIDGYDILNYTFIAMLNPWYKPQEYEVSINVLLHLIYKTTEISKRVRESHINSLNKLCNSPYIQMKQYTSASYMVNGKSCYYDASKGFYVSLYDTDLHKITTHDFLKKSLLIKCYAVIMKTLDSSISMSDGNKVHRGFVGHMPQTYMANLANVSAITISEQFKRLEQCNVLYVRRFTSRFKDSHGAFHTLTNLYGRYVDKDYITQYVDLYKEQYQSLINTADRTDSANYKRSMTQKYNRICAGYEYPPETVRQIYDYFCDLNDQIERQEMEEFVPEELSKKKDLSIFDQFDYLVQNDEWDGE